MSSIAKPPVLDWRRVAGRMRAELERADLNERARRLAMWSVKVTLAERRVSVLIPNRARVGAVLEISPQHFGTIAQELGEAGILTLKDVGTEGWELIVYPDSTFWNCRKRWEVIAMEGLLSEIANAPGQIQGELLEPEPCLAKAIAAVGAENAGASYQKGNHIVPEKGTNPAPLRSFKAESFSKPSKLKGRDALDVERLKAALFDIEGGPESCAVAGMRLILSEPVFENDGGKWRNRWREDRSRTHEVFAAMVEEYGRAKTILRPGGFSEWLWTGSTGRRV